jgi:MFS transporter, PAT family, beta-lactamase induction signal transducer AmpG
LSSDRDYGALRRWSTCFLLGFSSGLPYYVLVSLLPAWLRVSGVGLAEIAALNWLRLPYTWKFVWAPLIDRYSLPWLSRRRDWALGTQCVLLLLTAALGTLDPVHSLGSIEVLGVLIALFGASQDIAIDAYRRELLPDSELGLGNSLAVNGYRTAGLIPGGLALWLADHVSFGWVYLCVASCMLLGVLGSLWAPASVTSEPPPGNIRDAIIGPFKEFWTRAPWSQSATLIAFMLLYKLGDTMATILATPFYIDLGFTLSEIGILVKAVALWSMLAGSLIGGAVIVRIGINRALWLFGVVQMLSILGFAALAEIGKNRWALGAAVGFEYLGIGLGTAAFVAFLAQATNKRFTATQYALLSSLVALPGVALGSLSGLLVEALGFRNFFVLCTVLALPGLALLPKVAPWNAYRTVCHR